MGEKNVSDDSEEKIRTVAREVMDERVTKIKIGAQILRTVREVVDEKGTGAGLSAEETRKIAKLAYLEYTGLTMVIVGTIIATLTVIMHLIVLQSVAGIVLAERMLINQMVYLLCFEVATIMIGYLLRDYSRKKFDEGWGHQPSP